MPEIVERPMPVIAAIWDRAMGPWRRMQSKTIDVLSSRIIARSPVRKVDTAQPPPDTFDTDKTK